MTAVPLRCARVLLVAAAVLSAGCADPGTGPVPLILDVPPDVEVVLDASWVVDVDLAEGAISITAPGSGLAASRALADYFGADPEAEASLIGGDVVAVLPVPGSLEFAPPNVASGRRRVAFQIQVLNKLSSAALVGARSFPEPPPGTTGPVVFAVRNVVTTTDGSVTGDGNAVVVETPNEGTVASSDSIWSGPPHDFFNQGACGSVTGEVDGASDCFRYLEIEDGPSGSDTLGPLNLSAPLRVGYDLELTVNRFRSNLVLAADVVDAAPGGGGANLLGRWVVVTSATHPPGASLQEQDRVSPGDVLELQLCLLGFNTSAAELALTWDPSQLDLDQPAQPFQADEPGAHPDCAGPLDELDEFFVSSEAGRSVENRVVALDLTDPGAPYTAGLGRYRFTVRGASGETVVLTHAPAVVSAHGPLIDVSDEVRVDLDRLTIR